MVHTQPPVFSFKYEQQIQQIVFYTLDTLMYNQAHNICYIGDLSDKSINTLILSQYKQFFRNIYAVSDSYIDIIRLAENQFKSSQDREWLINV